MKKIFLALFFIISTLSISCEFDNVVGKFLNDGVLMFDYDDAFINRAVWNSLRIDQKKKLFAILLVYSEEYNKYKTLRIKDMHSGKELAKYGSLSGIKIYE